MKLIPLITAALVLAFTFGLAPLAEGKGRGKGGGGHGGGGGGGGGNRDRIREQVKWDAVPQAVQATITENARDGKIGAIEKETRRGATTYEAEVKRIDGKTIAIEVAADGELISVQVEQTAFD